MKKRNDTRIQALLPERAQRKECELESGLTKTYGTAPSASGCGNPNGNAMAETFFSILNAERINRSKPDALSEAGGMIDRYIRFYSLWRIQLKTGEGPRWRGQPGGKILMKPPRAEGGRV